MGALGIYKVALKYDILSFFRYLRAKRSRVASFVVGLVFLASYILLVCFVLSIPGVADALRKFQDTVKMGMSFISFVLMIIALSGGFSIVTSVRKGQRSIINLFLSSPTNPKDVFRAILINNSLAVVLLMTTIAYPTIIGILIAADISVLQVAIFGINLLIGMIAFASVGAALGVFYVRLTMRKKLILWSVLGVVGGFIYVSIFFLQNVIINVAVNLSIVLSETISPFRWYVSPLYMASDPIEYVLFALSVIFSISLIEGTSSILCRKYTAGVIKIPEERIAMRYAPKRGIIHRLYGPEVGGMFRKELRMIMREPAMVSSMLFAYIVLIFLLLNFTMNITVEGDIEPEVLQAMKITMFTIYASIMAVVSPMSIVSTALAMESRNLALLLSSPIDPKKIIKAKSLVSDIIVGVVIAILIPISLMTLDLYLAIAAILYIITITFLATGIMTVIVVKWTNFKASNPKKALRTTGSVISIVVLFITMIVGAAVGAFIATAPELTIYVIVAEIAAMIASFYIREKLIELAGKLLGKIEATEYL